MNGEEKAAFYFSSLSRHFALFAVQIFKLFLIDSRVPPTRSALRTTSHASRVPVQNGYKPSPFFKIQNPKLNTSLSPQSPMGGDSLGDAAGLACLAHEFEHGGVVENCRQPPDFDVLSLAT